MRTEASTSSALIEVVDQLDEALSILRVAWAGLCCDGEFLASGDDCRNAMNFATNMVERARDEAEKEAVALAEGRR